MNNEPEINPPLPSDVKDETQIAVLAESVPTEQLHLENAATMPDTR